MAAPIVPSGSLDAQLLDYQSLHSTQASAERYRAIADSSFDLICELDAEGQFVYLSPSFGTTTGLEAAQLVGTPFFERVHPEDRQQLITEFTAALAGSRVGRAEHRLRFADDSWRWFESALRCIGTGEDRRVVMVSREITARQRHQLELETLIALSKNVHVQSDLPEICDAIWEHLHPLLPATGLILSWRSHDTSRLEVYGRTAESTFRNAITRTQEAACPLWEAFEAPHSTGTWLENAWSGDSFSFPFGVRSFVSVPLRNDNSTSGVLFFASDRPFVWTENYMRLCLMAGEQAAVAVRGVDLLKTAKEAETRYRVLVNDLDAIVWEHDALAMRPTFVSEQAMAWLGYAPEKWLEDPKFWLQVVHEDDRHRMVDEVKQKNQLAEPWQVDFRAVGADGRQFSLRCLVTPEVRDGVVVKTRGLTLDVTERVRHLDAILESNTILAATLEASADGICLVDEKGTVVSFNKRFAEMWQLPPELVEEMRDRGQLMACILSVMRQPEEFIEKMNFLRQNPEASSRDEVTLRDGRIMERYSAPAVADDGRSFGRVWTFSDITNRKQYEHQLAHQAFHDALTDLPNRTLFMDRVEHGLSRLDRRGKALAVLFIDLDRFKLINDTMGHEKGDWLLKEVARRLLVGLRPGDTAARFGGDEFTLLLEDLNGVEDARAITERLIEALQAPIDFEGREMEITSSVGVAMSFSAHDRASDLLRNADIAMYRAKNKGKARYEIFDTKMSAAALERLQLEIELRQAVKWGQLRLMYQPLVDLETEMVIGTEALVRWDHPDRGVISPADFIPIAEESGMILAIGNWVLREACRQARQWQLAYPSPHPLKMSVNLSARQFQGTDLVAQVAAILEETGLPAQCLELEITESAVMEDAEATVQTLEQLKKLGVKLAIDDFGTGYSSLAYIERFPLDVLKIDRSFVAQIGKNGKNGKNGDDKKNGYSNDRSVVMQAVQTLGHGLGISITAEGIETPEQLAELRDMGCAIGQGFFWAKPLSSLDLGGLLQKKNGIFSAN
jgi:diguanylate cyclase (GGDEF)-like protein/PAS domain S-box-containing protein